MKPLRDNVLVQLEKAPTEGALVIVGETGPRRARVLAAGPSVDPEVNQDSVVFFSRGSGTALGDGKFILASKDILAVE